MVIVIFYSLASGVTKACTSFLDEDKLGNYEKPQTKPIEHLKLPFP